MTVVSMVMSDDTHIWICLWVQTQLISYDFEIILHVIYGCYFDGDALMFSCRCIIYTIFKKNIFACES